MFGYKNPWIDSSTSWEQEELNNKITKDTIKPMGVSQSRMIPVLVKAVQELSAKVTALENA